MVYFINISTSAITDRNTKVWMNYDYELQLCSISDLQPKFFIGILDSFLVLKGSSFLVLKFQFFMVPGDVTI